MEIIIKMSMSYSEQELKEITTEAEKYGKTVEEFMKSGISRLLITEADVPEESIIDIDITL